VRFFCIVVLDSAFKQYDTCSATAGQSDACVR
jgi:hypothetical protein